MKLLFLDVLFELLYFFLFFFEGVVGFVDGGSPLQSSILELFYLFVKNDYLFAHF